MALESSHQFFARSLREPSDFINGLFTKEPSSVSLPEICHGILQSTLLLQVLLWQDPSILFSHVANWHLKVRCLYIHSGVYHQIPGFTLVLSIPSEKV